MDKFCRNQPLAKPYLHPIFQSYNSSPYPVDRKEKVNIKESSSAFASALWVGPKESEACFPKPFLDLLTFHPFFNIKVFMDNNFSLKKSDSSN